MKQATCQHYQSQILPQFDSPVLRNTNGERHPLECCVLSSVGSQGFGMIIHGHTWCDGDALWMQKVTGRKELGDVAFGEGEKSPIIPQPAWPVCGALRIIFWDRGEKRLQAP